MVTQYPGNAIPAPGLSTGPNTQDLELMHSMHGYVQKGVTLKPGQGVLPLGTFLKQDPTDKRYVRATSAAEVEGVLRKTVDTGTSTDAQVWQANILFGGSLKLPLVSSANSGVSDLTTVLKAQVNKVAGFFRF